MKLNETEPLTHTVTRTCWRVFLVLWIILLGAQAQGLRGAVLLSCPEGETGDFFDRGFYIPSYPGKTMDSAQMEFSAGAAGTYSMRLTVRQNTYDGAVLGSSTASFTVSGSGVDVPVTFTFPSIPIPEGSRVCFILSRLSGPSTAVYYAVAGLEGGCTDVVETNDTTPPLSTFRRNGVKLTITGEYDLVVSPGQSIQAAIDAASPGDVVTVEPGTYHENLNLRSDVSVVGAGFRSTTLQGLGIANVIRCVGVTNSTFEGFKITGSGRSTSDAGVLISGGSSASFNNNWITSNLNGMRIQSGSSAVIRNNIVEGNGDDGNSVQDYGIIVLSSTPLISNNLIHDNEGVGIYIAWAASSGAQVINNTVVNNSSSGIWCYNEADAIIKNNIFTGNSTGISASHSSEPQISFNNVWQNSWRNYDAQSSGVAAPGLGDISADPMFDVTMDPPFALLDGSPCIDAGDPAPIYNDGDGSRNDMGAFGGPSALLPGLVAPVTSGFLFNNIGKIPTSEITDSGSLAGLANVSSAVAGALGIYPYKDAPFGGKLWLHGLFGSSDTGVRYYRIYKAKWTGSSAPALADFEPVTDPLSKIKYTVLPSGMVSSSLESVGPNADGLYLRTDHPSSGYWAHPDLKMIWNTRGVENGRYDLICKGYFYFFGVPFEVSLPANDLSRITVMVDNREVTASIDTVKDQHGTPIEECGVIPLLTDTEELQFEITATHPGGYLRNYALTATYGKNRPGGTIVADQYAGSNDGSRPTWAGVSGTTFSSVPGHTGGTLVPWTTCAYQFKLTAWARTTDGFNHIYHSTFSDHYYLTLDSFRASACAADLDGDGDVDGADLAIFASQFGRTNCLSAPVLP